MFFKAPFGGGIFFYLVPWGIKITLQRGEELDERIFSVFSVKRRLRTADYRLRTRGKMQTECKMQTAD